MKQDLEKAIAQAATDIFGNELQVELTRTDEQFGDYSTNVAMQLAAKLGKKPREIAEQLSEKLSSTLGDKVKEITVAGPGFINLKLSDQALWQAASAQPSQSLTGQIIVTEYSDPNPFKILHVGHLYTSIVGDAIANLLEISGGKVHRVNFGGDVGLHVARTMWAILQELGGEQPAKLESIALEKRSEWLAAAYIKGTKAYDEDVSAKQAITELNTKLYQIINANDHDSPLAQIYWTTRQWSYDQFDQFYDRIGSHFEKYYAESETAELGLETVKAQLGKVFEESDGAIVFRGEKYGLHTRVFVNSKGLPTYETKDVGLIFKKHQDFKFDRSIVLTGNEQQQYMAVVIKAIEQFAPELANASSHFTHGLVKLAGGVKMSSRLGNIIPANEILDMTAKAQQDAYGSQDETVTLGAVRYALLKQRLGADLIYNPGESVSLEGNSGPYLQYAYARARSIISKVGEKTAADQTGSDSLEPAERSLLRKISEYPEVVNQAVNELLPHYICTYLYELAQVFNHFYEYNRVIGDARLSLRLKLVEAYTDTLKKGLNLLNISAPESM